tara:strand:- start:309 stop:482 length:174 start_codon:yes stop_codon:yes gene_type:complete
MRYKVKDKYKNTSIQPGAKEVRLAFLNQEQIKVMISAGYDEYFQEVKTKAKKDNDKD